MASGKKTGEKQYNFRISNDLSDRFEDAVVARGQTKTEVLLDFIAGYVRDYELEKKAKEAIEREKQQKITGLTDQVKILADKIAELEAEKKQVAAQ